MAMRTISLKIKEFILSMIITSIVSFVLFCILFHLKLLTNIKVLLYRGMVFIIICGIINYLMGVLLKRTIFRTISYLDLFTIMLLFCVISLAFFVLVPVTAERSVSVYMLCEMADTDETYTIEDMDNKFINNYVKNFDAIDKRFNEQLMLGTIDKVGNDEYVISNRGKNIVSCLRWISKLFNIDKRIVYPNDNSNFLD